MDTDVQTHDEPEDDVEEETSADAQADTQVSEGGEDAARQAQEILERKIDVPDAEAVNGIIQGLAKMIPLKGTALVAIAKLSDDVLLVTIQPARGENESAETVIPLQVKGSPSEIDAELVAALADYVPARELALRTAGEIKEATALAAQAQKDAAAKKAAETRKSRTSAPPKNATLNVSVTPADATIRITGSDGKEQTIPNGKNTYLAAGKYTLEVSKPEHDTHTASLTLVAFKTERCEITLKQTNQQSLFTGTAA